MNIIKLSSLAFLAAIAATGTALADGHFEACTSKDWVLKSDAEFASDCAEMAFSGTLEDRQRLAWMFFARTNLQIKGGTRLDKDTGTAPLWMAWPTDPETFPPQAGVTPSFEFEKQAVDEVIKPSVPKTELAGIISDTTQQGVPNSGEEEVTRNQISYEYIVENNLYTTPGVQAFTQNGRAVEMPVGSIEIKAKWIKVASLEAAPLGSFVFEFFNPKAKKENQQGYYYWGGMHIMAKMRPSPSDVFTDNSGSWFWTTFEFKGNPGVKHVVETLITQKSPLHGRKIEAIMDSAGLLGLGYEAYAPNGTQISFVDADNKAVILGHTQMESFAGVPAVGPNGKPCSPQDWTGFTASCHTCHATAAYRPTTTGENGIYYPFTVPIGALPKISSCKVDYTVYQGDKKNNLGDCFVSLDFMWPIPSQAREEE